MMSTAVDYAGRHSDSPIALACSTVGPVRVVDNLRADIAHGVSTRDLRRAYALGVCSASSGFAPDVHQHDSGLWPDLSPADYLARWIRTALQWADKSMLARMADNCGSLDEQDRYEAARSARLDQWAAELVTVAPAWYVDWLARLIHPPKWGYLVEIGAAQWLGEPKPYRIETDWAEKVRRQWTRRAQGIAQVARVVKALEEF